MTGFDLVVGGFAAAFVAVYLGYALLRPERF
ncbi:potassium-transporting ATPase subunit F [Aureimonas altamirensis]|nr:potassium-transporting ATPase subunit F [Aureimonas altamirensis]MCM2504327.1 potassium-transporting ATPase subunit F [Aureimonas altamirensis]